MTDWTVIASILAVLGIPYPARPGANPETLTDGVINSQVRLAYAGPTGMTVTWNTFYQLDSPRVNYGFQPHYLPFYAESNVSVTYDTALTYNNHVTLTGLQPDTLYYYLPEPLLFDNATVAPYSFRTARPAGDGTPYSIAVAIDLGTMGSDGLSTSAGEGVPPGAILGPNDNNTMQSLQAVIDTFDFLWQPGDMSYADYWLKEEIEGYLPNTTIADGAIVYESIQNNFYDQMTPITTRMAYMVGPGNHEADCDVGGAKDPAHNITYTESICMPGQTNFTGFINRFRMPSAQSGGTGNFWYSFDQGMVHYIQLDTETDLGHGHVGPEELGGVSNVDAGPFGATKNAQTDWLEQDLASVDRTKTPWVIVAGHRPWYLSYANVSKTICWDCKDVFEPLLIQYGVDLVISGHSHLYQRSAPIADGVIDPNELDNPSAPWYITNGAAGHYSGLSALAAPKPYQRFGLDVTDGVYGWSRLTFHNCTHMTHEYVASKNGTVMDTATLFKDRTCALT
ncbi:Purple acid phosphatase [Venustampulla echinocandica]|uniref:Purple acid phosphatase n=1 Tax=Venustampulla echinocandica TaxID=2656787 RepID=A0A370TAR9_9HELO|nr:Purple acid phosphatase [Venustampulla echinocandica]RDL31035.1 Purple acid phosphatase [Venustampulla echinocandica]